MNAMPVLLAGAEPIEGSKRRLRLVGDALDGFAYRSGQRVAVTVKRGGAALRLLCRIERFDAAELRLDTILAAKTDSAAERWARRASIGDPLLMELVR